MKYILDEMNHRGPLLLYLSDLRPFTHSAVLKTITIRSVGHHTVPRLRRHRALAPLLPSSEYRRAESRTDCGITNGDDLCLISKRERAVAGINIYS